ncbi:MAG: hypothetical protein GX620_16405, partial [Chloroflexi bacterium]|nr:hypothetical protein [Chloroflexota bacterium]
MESVFPHDIFLFGIPIRDTIISTWIMMAGIIGIILFLRHRHPNVMETLISFISSLVTDFMDHPIEPY